VKAFCKKVFVLAGNATLAGRSRFSVLAGSAGTSVAVSGVLVIVDCLPSKFSMIPEMNPAFPQ
jgi:hypothetical protein